MSRFKNPLQDTRASLALISDPMKEHREMLAALSDPMKAHREMLAALSDPMKEHREMLAALSDPMKEHREIIAAFSDPMRELRTSLALISAPNIDIHKALQGSVSLNSIKDIALSVKDSIEVDNEGGITLSSKRITAAELQELSDKIFHKSSLAELHSFDEAINRLISEISALKDPITQKILIYFVYPLIIIIIASFINPIVSHHVRSNMKLDKRSLVKELKVNVNKNVYNQAILNSLRYVSADTLNVRSSASINSDSIGYLRFSSAVLILEKQKNWTLIEWNDPDADAKITGWVFTRYLKRFR